MTAIASAAATTPASSPQLTGLLSIPNELLLCILEHVPTPQLVTVALTCRRLRFLAFDNQIWNARVNDNLAEPIGDPAPARSFHELYAAHHPYWFLTKHRIWFADTEPSGKLLIARYNKSRGSIEAYTVTGHIRRNHDNLEDEWVYDPDVIIHRFDPVVALDLRQPVLRLDFVPPRQDDQLSHWPPNSPSRSNAQYNKEVMMSTFNDAGLFSSFALCRRLPESAVSWSTSVWPPLTFPTTSRARNTSHNDFNSSGHRPNTLAEVSPYHFRLRKWVEYRGRRTSSVPFPLSSTNGLSAVLGVNDTPFGGPFISALQGGVNIRMPEDVTTYAALPRDVYMPTPQKPWQGVWVGDYSGHGCEFLLLLQPDKGTELPLPPGLDRAGAVVPRSRSGSLSSMNTGSSESFSSAHEDVEASASAQNFSLGTSDDVEDAGNDQAHPGDDAQRSFEWDAAAQSEDPNQPSGRLEALKLTGDSNIPRAEYTWIAPDIGSEGLIRIADEAPFQGARIVRSAGHIAAAGFLHDQYITSQLIMISHDKLAQFWEAFGHISYYRRVDLDALMRVESPE